MKILSSCFAVLWASFLSFAQDFHFSQVNETPLMLNPGLTGLFKGWERGQVNHRNQWLGANTQFMTSSLGFDMNLMKNRQQNNAHMGVGVFVFNDVGGDSKFGVQSASLSVSGILPLSGSKHVLSVGIQSGFTSRKGDLSQLTWENQWDGTQFNTQAGSGEPGSILPFRHFDAAAGIVYQYNGSRNAFQRSDEHLFKIGFSVFHVNKPQLTYTNYMGSYLYRKFVAHISLSKDIPSSSWSYEWSGVQFMQGPHFETLLGIMFKNRMQSGTKSTGYYQDSYFGMGVYARIKDAIIPRVYYQFGGFRIGVSYDLTISDLRRAHRGGSLEFNLTYCTNNTATHIRGGR